MSKLLNQNILFTLITFEINKEEKFILNICQTYRGNHIGKFEIGDRTGICIPSKGQASKLVMQYIDKLFAKAPIDVALGSMGKSEMYECKDGVSNIRIVTEFFNKVVEQGHLGRYKLSELLCLDSKDKVRYWENILKFCEKSTLDNRHVVNVFRVSNLDLELPTSEWLNQHGEAFNKGYNRLAGNQPQPEERGEDPMIEEGNPNIWVNPLERANQVAQDTIEYVTDLIWETNPATGEKTARVVKIPRDKAVNTHPYILKNTITEAEHFNPMFDKSKVPTMPGKRKKTDNIPDSLYTPKFGYKDYLASKDKSIDEPEK